MITWFQTFFLKHNKWLFSLLLIVIIVTFVLTIGNQSFFGGPEVRETESVDYYGYDLNSARDQRTIGLHGQISAQLHPEFGLTGANLQYYALMRVSALGLAGELGIISPNDDQLRAFVENLQVFQGENGSFDTERYAMFRDFASAQIEGGQATLARVLREDYRITRVREVLGGPGYVLPHALAEQLRQRDTQWTIALAQRSYNDFRPEVNPDEATIRAFYDADPARYTIPERIEVSAVRFTADRFLSDVETPPESALLSYFNRNRFRYQPTPDPENPDAEIPEVTLEQARDQVLNDWLREQGRQLAQQASDAFITALYEGNITRSSDAFNTTLAQYKGVLAPVAPYSRNNPPQGTGIPAETFRSMWIYTTGDRYYSDPAVTANGAAVLGFEQLVPGGIPPFEEVAQAAEADWRAEERRRLFAAAAQEWEDSLRAAVEAGTSFADAATEAGFMVETPESFDGSNPPRELFQLQLVSEFVGIEAGELSPIVLSNQAAALFHVIEKVVPDIDSAGEDYLSFFEEVRTNRQLTGGFQALEAWTEESLRVVAPPDEDES